MGPHSGQTTIVGKRSPQQARSPAINAAQGISYAILSQPRTGSTLLSELLRARGMGDPDEYLHENRIRVWWPKLAGSNDGFDVQRYMTLLRQSQSGPDGHFGIKVHYSHLRKCLGDPEPIHDFFVEFDRIIVLTRADKLSQAVSALKAEQTKRWGAATPKAKVEPRFDPVALAENLRRFMFQDQKVAQLITAAGRPTLFVTYEELRDSINETWESVQKFLGIPPVPVPAAIRTRPQRDAQSVEFEKSFLEFIRGEQAAGQYAMKVKPVVARRAHDAGASKKAARATHRPVATIAEGKKTSERP